MSLYASVLVVVYRPFTHVFDTSVECQKNKKQYSRLIHESCLINTKLYRPTAIDLLLWGLETLNEDYIRKQVYITFDKNEQNDDGT